jgi:hypothetical protein
LAAKFSGAIKATAHLDEKREKRAEARSKKVAEAKKAMEGAEGQAQHDGGVEAAKEEDKKE